MTSHAAVPYSLEGLKLKGHAAVGRRGWGRLDTKVWFDFFVYLLSKKSFVIILLTKCTRL